ncbi:hypothetical protein [uncultured Methanobrevibacter sp.]|uniref:hypothetical protein n=1 Tax=uncultured Methanobrevibacter sp. TaxID=253161 RepID=UPI00262818CD|nr:hypothetical protein [uncultured Methanobrevibacter sp.]
MNEIKFNITNNAWNNNGLVRLIIELKKNFFNDVLINEYDDCVILFSNTDKDISFYLNAVINYLAIYGTYNFSQIFKIINYNLNLTNKFVPNKEYPNEKTDFKKTKDITKDYRDELKEKGIKTVVKSKEQIWKQRMSYINSSDKYLSHGLKFESTSDFKKMIENEFKNKTCPNCGSISKYQINILQSINPLINEHHNNENEGFSTNFRKNPQFCPNCLYLSWLSVFDKYIPFYKSGDVFLALPNIENLNILEKIATNLSLDSQYINFSDPNVMNYNSNIKNFNNNSKYAALLSLLHNIQNNFSKDVDDDVFQMFTETELMDIVDWIFITKDSFSINRIQANRNVYKILIAQKDTKGNDIYLVNDFLNKINFGRFMSHQIDKFFKSFLELDYNNIALSLFEMLKSEISFFGGYYPIFLFKEIFLNQIMGEILMLDRNFKEACRSIASNIGKSFYKDVGLLSKFAYATDKQSFNQYIEEAFFLMAKKSALSDVEFYSNGKELEVFFDEFENEDFAEVKSYFVSFMSSSALYEKQNQN